MFIKKKLTTLFKMYIQVEFLNKIMDLQQKIYENHTYIPLLV